MVKKSTKKKIANYHSESFSRPTTPPRLTSSETKHAKNTHFGIRTAKPIKKNPKQPKMNPKKKLAKARDGFVTTLGERLFVPNRNYAT